MLRKSLALAVLTLAGAGFYMGGINFGRTADAEGKDGLGQRAPYAHVVIFHLKKVAPPGEADALVADAHELLRPIPSVRDLRAGRPAVKAKPDRARADYQVALLVLFDNQEGLDMYQVHPNHLKYVEKHLKYVEADQLAIYDFIDQKK